MAVSAKYNSPEVGVPGLYQGLMAWAFVWAFVDAYSIGANDVANAFANAVGSGTLTHRGACTVACFFELAGCIALGSQVTDTIRTKVTLSSPDAFDNDEAAPAPVQGMWPQVAES